MSHISAILASQTTVIVGTMALGMALVIITGGIDLSVGSGLVLVTGVTIMAYNATSSIIVMLLAALIVGALCGLINGLMVGCAKMPAFVATLGTQLIYRSVTLTYVRMVDPALSGSSSSQFSMISSNKYYNALRMGFGTGKLNLGFIELPYITILFFVLLALFIIISTRTKYGKSIYAVGSNVRSARLAGINVTFVYVSVYVIVGFLVGIASFLQACKLGNITPASSGMNYELYAIASVVLGGVNMAGGRGNILGVLFGALSYTTINFIIVSIPSLSTDMQDACQGLVLIVVILIQTLSPIIKAHFNTAKKRKANEALAK
ncbi:MAG: ABC transporter permease [Lachnospiraceae bacterium]|nr:ABC transporter permease [Lachnospiraceae bacterium]